MAWSGLAALIGKVWSRAQQGEGMQECRVAEQGLAPRSTAGTTLPHCHPLKARRHWMAGQWTTTTTTTTTTTAIRP